MNLTTAEGVVKQMNVQIHMHISPVVYMSMVNQKARSSNRQHGQKMS